MIKTVYFSGDYEGSELWVARVGKENDFDTSNETNNTFGQVVYGGTKLVLERECRGEVQRDVLYIMTDIDKGHSINNIVDICASLDERTWICPIREIKIILSDSIPWRNRGLDK